jgi:hypothetical protein
MRVHAPAEALGDRAEELEEIEAVDVFDEDVRASVPTGRDVEVAVRKLAPRRSRHPAKLAPNARR